ncbi:MAG TPA: DUF503 domain-containing protein [Acidimicrobiales bacterium]|nr:DUF503 domain-containing protein [Acidimicrobiales bacterium]
MRHRALRLPGPQARRRDRDVRGAGDPTHVGVVRFDLHIPLSHSLKEKRAVVKPIVDGARRRFAVASAETGYLDKWQRAELGMATVAGEPAHVERVLDGVERFVLSFPEVEVVSVERSLSGFDDGE